MRGILTVYAGPMFAGKSAHLLAHDVQGKKVLCLSPAFDKRSGATIHSRTGVTRPARSVSLWPDDAGSFTHILLDEVHFMTAPHYLGDVVADIATCLSQGIDVTVAGLDMDYNCHDFEVVTRLKALADHVVMLVAQCHVCGQPAHWTAKKRHTGHKLETGDGDLYEARCNVHWTSPAMN